MQNVIGRFQGGSAELIEVARQTYNYRAEKKGSRWLVRVRRNENHEILATAILPSRLEALRYINDWVFRQCEVSA